MTRFNQVGKDLPRVDGQAKVTGQAIYGDDIKLPGMLYGVCRYTDIPAGKILSIDTSEADAIEGVVRIATFNDIPGDPTAGVIIRDYQPICHDLVRYSGDVIAVVAAETYEAACLAADKIKIEYEPFTPINNVHEALESDARLIHPASGSNIVAEHHTNKGDAEQAIEQADIVIERNYQVGFQEHGYIEPESVTAYLDPTTHDLIVTGSIQNPHRVRGFVSSFMGMNQANVNVCRAVMGGSFGGKDDGIDHLACRTALMATLTGRPVKITYTREQSIIESTKRHPYHMHYKVGFNHDGRILGIKINILADAGAYAACTPFVTWRSVVQAAGPYDIDHVHVDIKGVYTNNSMSGAMRGFGSPQIIFANESLMDEIADACQLDPIAVRAINALKQGSQSITGQHFDNHTVSAIEVLNKAAVQAEFQTKQEHYNRLNAGAEPVKYGVGLALSYRGCSMGAEGVDTSSALITVNADGSVNVSTGVCENGQGLQTTMSTIAAEVLGLDLASINFVEPPTSLIADGGPTVASRATMTGGNAVKDGAEKIKSRIFEVIKTDLGVSTIEETLWANNAIHNKQDPARKISFADAANKTKWAGVNLAAYGWFDQPEIHWDEEKGFGSPYFTWVYGCQIVDLKVDTSTGKVELLDITAVHDVGQVINQIGFEGQVAGGIAQGIGLGVLEDYNIEYGKVKSENLDSYLLPTIKDIPPLTIQAVENADAGGPFGAKSIGEPAAELAAAAITNAVAFATGTRHRQLPLTLEQIYLGYNLKKPARQSELVHASEEKKQTLRLNGFSVVNPTSLDEALAILADGTATALAGGTDILVQGRLQSTPRQLINIAGLEELCQIEESEHCVTIGGGVNFNRLTEHPAVKDNFPLLAKACHTIGSNQIRNRATVGGNIVNAAPCADSVPPLVVYEAEVELRTSNTIRRLPLSQFITGGYRTELQQGELLTRVFIPKLAHPTFIQKYSQLGRRNALNITRLSLTCLMDISDDGIVQQCRLVDGALFSKPQRLTAVEELLVGSPLSEQNIKQASHVLMDMIDSAIGGRWSAVYKQPVYLNMFRDLMNDIRAQGEAL
ncbi:molybdopterin-dependent oxidoreductase [Photobacterium sp. SDRW27]|uniref:molybdopterin cofactor-binding domain-containing protein n=1 Tax=Photobacterium obscurum TaxID=2829490 RepID=UPI0022431D83|nr:molybdopterin cofactor-binding domain-containing protein [Photobacterium obscurum]MCW8331164.1 molybdopterin-dependent oxidoreductase [Photobacterium obscurum]